MSAVRYSNFVAHHHVPFGIIAFTDIIYLSSGLLNVLLFSITRPFLLPHDLPKLDEVSEVVIHHSIRVTSSLHNDSTDEEGRESYQWPRVESPVSHLQSDFIGEASTNESEAPLYYKEALEVRHGSLDASMRVLDL